MKILITITILSLSILGCKEASDKIESTMEQKDSLALEMADTQLKFEEEKIVLLSSIKGLSYDTLKSILRSYYSETQFDFYDDAARIKEAIAYTAKKHNLPESKIASLVFIFKYEMRAMDDIEELEIDIPEDPRY